MAQGDAVVSDFTINVYSVNGTGTQSANNMLTRALFRMGLAVTPKNIFPSNIQGMPTWYRIRVCEKGYQCAKDGDDILVFLNPNTFQEDLKKLEPGMAYFYAASPKTMPPEEILQRTDVTGYGIPADELAKEHFEDPKLRSLMKNMIVVGAVTESIGVDEAVMNKVVADSFPTKPSVQESNKKAIAVGREFFRSLGKKDPFRVAKGTVDENKVLVDGNTLAALGTVMGGCTFASWYPITPSSSLMENVEKYFKKYRRSADGTSRYAMLQGEDEIACVGMIVGAGYAGARSMTATSGPGLSLMTEIVGLAYYTETPCVIWDVQRVGPSTGLPTRTQQADILFAAFMGHGDTKHPLLFPMDPTECFDMAQTAFDLAERFQTPVLVMSDLDIGMNLWMCDAPKYPTQAFDRGKVLTKDDLERLQKFARYDDIDKDGVPYRTLPGTAHPLATYFTRGSGHNERAGYSEDPKVYERMMARLELKWESIRKTAPQPVVEVDNHASIGVIAIGSSHYPLIETLDHYKAKGLPLDYMRIKAFPFADEVRQFINNHETIFVLDQNRDGQLKSLIQISLADLNTPLVSVRVSDGLPLTAGRLIPAFDKQLEEGVRKNQWRHQKTS